MTTSTITRITSLAWKALALGPCPAGRKHEAAPGWRGPGTEQRKSAAAPPSGTAWEGGSGASAPRRVQGGANELLRLTGRDGLAGTAGTREGLAALTTQALRSGPGAPGHTHYLVDGHSGPVPHGVRKACFGDTGEVESLI